MRGEAWEQGTTKRTTCSSRGLVSDDTGHPGTYGEGGGRVRDLVGKKKKRLNFG